MFGALLVGTAFFSIVHVIFLAVIAAISLGVPIGFAAGQARTPYRAAVAIGGFWGALIGSVQILYITGGLLEVRTAGALAAHLAFLLSVVSFTALCGGCVNLLCRAVLLRDEPRQPFQFTLAEMLLFSTLFAVCLGCGLWFKQLTAEDIAILRQAGHFPVLP